METARQVKNEREPIPNQITANGVLPPKLAGSLHHRPPSFMCSPKVLRNWEALGPFPGTCRRGRLMLGPNPRTEGYPPKVNYGPSREPAATRLVLMER